MTSRVREATLVGVLGTLVGMAGSWRPSLWTDEVATLSGANRSWTELRHLLGNIDAVHGLYYALLHLWTSVSGTSPVALRLPSAVAVGLAAAGVYVLGDRLGGTRPARWAGAVLVVVPGATGLAVEARSGACVMAASVWATVALVSAVDRGGRRWIAYGGLLTLSILLFVQSAAIVLAHGLTMMTSHVRRDGLRHWALTCSASLIVAAPLGVVAFRQREQVSWIVRPGVGSLRLVAFHQWFDAAIPAGLLLFALSAVTLMQYLRRPASRNGQPFDLVGLSVPWLVVPTVVVLTVSVLASPMYVPRYLTYTLPPLALLVGASFGTLRPAWLRFAIGATLVVAVVPTYIEQRSEYAKEDADFSAAARYLAGSARPGDAILFLPDGGQGRSPRRVVDAYPDDLPELDDVGLRVDAEAAGRPWDVGVPVDELTEALDGVGRVWVLTDPVHYADEVETGLGTLSARRFSLRPVWRGPTTVVYLATPAS